MKDPDFTLLQAVGALEIMDPKMDSGLLEPEYESFEVMAPRIPEEVLGIMDQLLCHEVGDRSNALCSIKLTRKLRWHTIKDIP